MTADYKKRSQSGYSKGKKYKKLSNRSERLYEPTDISEQIQEFTKPFVSKKKRSGIHKEIEKQISSYRSALRFVQRWNNYQGSNWISSTFMLYKNEIKKLTPMLESYILRDDADNKLVKQIKEILNA